MISGALPTPPVHQRKGTRKRTANEKYADHDDKSTPSKTEESSGARSRRVVPNSLFANPDFVFTLPTCLSFVF
jgi:hypothetical protein